MVSSCADDNRACRWVNGDDDDNSNNNNNKNTMVCGRDSRVVSANSSFFRLILSFKVSASRRACWMRACMASGDTSSGRCESMVGRFQTCAGEDGETRRERREKREQQRRGSKPTGRGRQETLDTIRRRGSDDN